MNTLFSTASRLIAVLLLGSSCTPELSGETPTPTVTPVTAVYPSWEQTTWSGYFLERYDEHVQAYTDLRFNIEEQEGASFQALIYHFFGYIIIDGIEVPVNSGIDIDGEFLGNNRLELEGAYYGHSLRVLVDYEPIDLVWFAHLDLDDGYYQKDVMMVSSTYVPFQD